MSSKKKKPAAKPMAKSETRPGVDAGAVRELARRHGRIGVVWFDAHGDLNTPESSPSGNAWGMPLRMLIDAGDVAPGDVTLIGARNLDLPVAQQYWIELNKYLHLDFGLSYGMADFSVNDVIAAGLPVSATLGILALAFALALGLTAGIISAVRRGGWLDFSLMSLATVGIAVPNFVVASGIHV